MRREGGEKVPDGMPLMTLDAQAAAGWPNAPFEFSNPIMECKSTESNLQGASEREALAKNEGNDEGWNKGGGRGGESKERLGFCTDQPSPSP